MKQVMTSERIPIKLWLDDIGDKALAQAKDLANLFFAWKWIAIMPDSHLGYGMPIGGVMATRDVIVPNAVGVDIGCGVMAVKLSITDMDTETIKKILGRIREVIPVGFNHNVETQSWNGFNDAPDIPIIQQELHSARKQLGTLGGGNHFIEIQKGSDNHIWVMIHSGSRNFGYKTAKEYHERAKKMCMRWKSDIPNLDLAFLPMEDEGSEYYKAMGYCLDFAKANRNLMMSKAVRIISEITGAKVEHKIDIHHNYAAFEHHFGKNVLVHRKGATKAMKNSEGIIPGSMGTNSYITIGLGDSDSFMSSSHGAGRRMGRKQAKKNLNLKDEQERMEGIVHGLRTRNDLGEAPGAYKDIEVVMENQKDLVEISIKLLPLGVIKG